MAMSFGAGETLQFRVWCQQGEQASVNSFYYKCSAVTGQVSDVAAAVQFDTMIAAVLKPLISNVATFLGTQCRVMKTPTPASADTNANAGPGTGGVDGLPRQIAGLITKRTNLAGRGYRGRLYLPFPSTDSNVGEAPSIPYLALCDNLTLALFAFTTITDAGAASATVSQVLWKKPPVSPVPIVALIPQGKWATQRRRGSYGRPNVSPIS